MPFVEDLCVFGRALRFRLVPAFVPPGPGHFVRVTEIAVFHHIIDSDPAIAIVVVIRLPERAK